MNKFKSIMIDMAIPLVVDIITDIITPEGVVKFRNNMLAKIESFTSKTANTIDDSVVKSFVGTFLFTSGPLLDSIFDMIEAYVKDSETKYDDNIISPIIVNLRKVLNIQDN